MAHFVYNSGRSRGGAWEAKAPFRFLDQTEAAPKGPKKNFLETGPPLLLGSGCSLPLSEGLDPPLYNNIATTASKAFTCLVVLVEGKFYGFRVSKSLISFVLLQRMKQNINYQTT